MKIGEVIGFGLFVCHVFSVPITGYVFGITRQIGFVDFQVFIE